MIITTNIPMSFFFLVCAIWLLLLLIFCLSLHSFDVFFSSLSRPRFPISKPETIHKSAEKNEQRCANTHTYYQKKNRLGLLDFFFDFFYFNYWIEWETPINLLIWSNYTIIFCFHFGALASTPMYNIHIRNISMCIYSGKILAWQLNT